MRKDVKIGLAIAGVLFAVLIVYAFVPKKDANQEQYSAGDGQQQVDEGAATDGTGTSPEPTEPAAGQQDPALADGGNKDAFATDANTADPASAAAAAGTGTAAGGTTDWLKTIETGSVVGLESHPPLIAQTQTPTAPGTGTGGTQTPPTGSGAAGQGGTAAPDTAGGTPAIPAVGETVGGNTGSGAGRPAQRNTVSPAGGSETSVAGGNNRIIADPAPPGPAAGGGQRTHVIQRNETLSSIAKAVYGKQSYYLQIQKANPTIDPNRLRPGTTITLPDISTIDASTAAKPAAAKSAGSQSDAASPAVNPQTEYRIQPGDSLYRISVKLYGDGGHVDELYENNAKTIGDDPARLKVGTVLKLHDAPRVKAAR